MLVENELLTKKNNFEAKFDETGALQGELNYIYVYYTFLSIAFLPKYFSA